MVDSVVADRGDITIIGAGLAGALLGALLARQGLKVRIHEKRGDPRVEEYEGGRSINLALAERGYHALRLAGADDEVIDQCVMMRGRMVHNRNGTHSFLRYGKDDTEVIWSVHRGDLNSILLNFAADAGVEIYFHHELQTVDFESRRIRLLTPDGPLEESFTSLIGADGAGSALRRAMADRDPQQFTASTEFLGHGYKELEIPPFDNSGDFSLEPNALHIWPRGTYMCIALPNDEKTFTVTLFLPNEGSPSFAELQTGEEARAFFDREFQSASIHIDDLEYDWEHNPVGVLGTLYLDHWAMDDRAVLLGDAAHAMVPFHGQGMNAAFEDCVALARHLGAQSDRAAAFRAFQEERLPNARAIQQMALDNYLEMRDKVDDPLFLLQRELEIELSARHPERFLPHYTMVTFRLMPYREAYERTLAQNEILDELTRDIDSADQVDWDRAAALVSERLPLFTDVTA